MAELKIAIVYFSATNVTHSYVEIVRDELLRRGCAVQTHNVTALESRRQPPSLDGCDGVIFGFPVFSSFAPSVINEWLPTLSGKGTKCATFFTYGGRTSAYAHFHTSLLLKQADFRLLLTAEFLGRHSFNVGGWQVLSDRPDEGDFSVAREFAGLAMERFSRDEALVLMLQKPFGYPQVMAELQNTPRPTERHWTNPLRTAEDCSMCRNCETECPAGAFDADTGLSDPGTCIGCMHCVYICPDEVVHVPGMIPEKNFLLNWNLTQEMIRAKRSRIITESWQAAF
jgi:ferredoxin